MRKNIALFSRAGRWFGAGFLVKPNPERSRGSRSLFLRLAGTLPGMLLLGLLATNGGAQVFTNLHSFTARSGSGGYNGTNSDGEHAFWGLLLSGNTLYGATQLGEGWGWGTVFAVNTDGTGFTNLHSFAATSGTDGFYGFGTNTDGILANGGFVLSGNTLYGTAQAGGTFGWGTVFAINTDGTGFTNLHNFTATSGTNFGGFGFNSDGAYPFSKLVLSGNTLYGTAQCGGTHGYGTVFAINKDGTGFTNLHSFTATSGSTGGEGVNSEGVNPIEGLILSDNRLYGTAVQGGTHGYGTVFAVNTDGTGFTNLHNFTDGSDGGYPWDALILPGDTLYGTSAIGGSSGYGTVFAVNINGTGFRTVHSFTGGNGGASPRAELILSGNTLYGTTCEGGTYNYGTVFTVNTKGTGFTILHNFAGSSAEGVNPPSAGLTLAGTTLFGATWGDAASGYGTVFSLSYPSPQLTVTPSGTDVNLSWPCAMAGFSYSGCTLQSTTNLASPAVWNAVSQTNVVVNGQNTVTCPMIGSQMFFQLSQ
jgi:uncharacterized repeat protein (TIGR03803 family)